MKVLKIEHKDVKKEIPLDNKLFVMCMDADGCLFVETVDYDTLVKSIWFENFFIDEGSPVRVKMGNVDNPIGQPVKVTHVKGEVKPYSKLERFKLLEQSLKTEGML